MSLIKQCGNCEFNFGGTCAGGDNDAHPYGAIIADETATCDGWGASLDCCTEITKNAPWYIKEPYDSIRIDYGMFEELLEADGRGEAIAVNIYDAIKHIYKISLVDLAVALDVNFNVIYRAKTHGTSAKRQVPFSKTLCLPQKFFTKATTHDFDELAQCAAAFTAQADITAIGNAMPDWKLAIAVEASTALRCPLHIAKEIARVDFLKWTSAIPLSELSSSEKALIGFINAVAKQRYGKDITSYEYSLDNGGHVRIGSKYF